MPNQEESVSRRGFLKAAVVTTAAAAAAGAGAAKLAPLLGQKPVQVTTIPATVTRPPVAAVPAAPAHSDLLGQLAATQAENLRLKADLDAALRRLEAAQTANHQPSAEVELLNQQLGAANEQVTLLAGLVALYDQLEGIEWEGALESGIGSVSLAFTGLIDDIPDLLAGIEDGARTIAEFEAHVPILENGRAWLGNHLIQLDDYYRAFEQMLQQAVDSIGPVLDMLQKWFDGILKWLPFGMGSTAVQVMGTITTLMREMPVTVQGTHTNIAQPLDAWLAKEQGEQDTRIAKRLFKPLRERALQPAAQTAEKVQAAKTTYDEQLVGALQHAIQNRQVVQQLIANYRQQNGL